jgi:hypothetical protein
MSVHRNTGCPTRYRTQHFFNNVTTNEDIAKKFEADLLHCVRNVKEKNVLLFKFRCNIFISVRIIKEMPGLVASGTLYIIPSYNQQDATFLYLFIPKDAVHVTGGFSAHHQEHTTVQTASGIVSQYCC